jgi:hypothetical protein
MPLCGFYAASFARVLALFEAPAHVEVRECRGAGQARCLMLVRFGVAPARNEQQADTEVAASQ